jgi:hypothetical protein
MWKNDKQNGKGVRFYSNGDVCIGEHKEGEWKGKGTLISPNGDVKFVQFKDGYIYYF